MYKLIAKPTNYLLKSFDIIDLWRLVVSHPEWTYQFYIDYTPITKTDFLSFFLKEEKSYKSYMTLYLALNPTKTIYEYIKPQRKELLNSLKNIKNVKTI